MITAILAVLVIFCLLYERIPLPALVPLSLGLGVAFALLGRDRRTRFLTIDVLAQTSRLNELSADLKVWTALVLMLICLTAQGSGVGILLTLLLPVIIVKIGGIKLEDYIHMLVLPLSFLMISGLALLIEVTRERTGIIGVPVFGHWLCISEGAQVRAAIVMSRALGAVSCLYLISLTTPMSDIIGVLRRVHCPNVLIELMYLIYRYIFVLLSMYHTMRDAAKSRLGYASFRASIRTTGNLYSNLLERSYRQANRHFDAMESRCYDTKIRFLESRVSVSAGQALAAAGIVIMTLSVSLLSYLR